MHGIVGMCVFGGWLNWPHLTQWGYKPVVHCGASVHHPNKHNCLSAYLKDVKKCFMVYKKALLLCLYKCSSLSFVNWPWPETDLILWVDKLLLYPLVQLFEGQPHDGGTLVHGGHDGLEDAGQVGLQHLHAAVPYLRL